MGQISFTLDSWSDQNRRSYLAITAHWIAQVEGTSVLQHKSALIAFHCLRESHTGEFLAATVVELLDRAEITTKVRPLFLLVIHACSFIQGGTFHHGQRVEQWDYDGGAQESLETP